MVHYLWWILRGLKIGQGNWASHLLSARSFQELYSTVGMGLFIGISGATHGPLKNLLYTLDKGIKAHLCLMPKQFVYNLYWAQIYNSRILSAYFEQFDSWRRFIKKRLENTDIWDFINITDDLVFLLLSVFQYYTSFRPLIEYITNPWLFQTAIREQHINDLEKYDHNLERNCESILGKLHELEEKQQPIMIYDKLVHFFHPIIDLEWLLISTAIHQLHTFSKVEANYPGGLRGIRSPAPYVKGQRFKVLDNGQVVQEGIISSQANITHEITLNAIDAKVMTAEEIQTVKNQYGPHSIIGIQLDTHGIKSPQIGCFLEQPVSGCYNYGRYIAGMDVHCAKYGPLSMYGIKDTPVMVEVLLKCRSLNWRHCKVEVEIEGHKSPQYDVTDDYWTEISFKHLAQENLDALIITYYWTSGTPQCYFYVESFDIKIYGRATE